MEMGYKYALAGFAIGALSILTGGTAMAQEVRVTPEFTQPGSIPDQFDRAFSSNDRTFYENRSEARQFNFLFGVGSIVRSGFVENEINRDGRAINNLYRQVLTRQLSNSPIIRTQDIPNPFNTSVRLLPRSAEASRQLPGQPPIVETAPSSTLPPGDNRSPVPALW